MYEVREKAMFLVMFVTVFKREGGGPNPVMHWDRWKEGPLLFSGGKDQAQRSSHPL